MPTDTAIRLRPFDEAEYRRIAALRQVQVTEEDMKLYWEQDGTFSLWVQNDHNVSG